MRTAAVAAAVVALVAAAAEAVVALVAAAAAAVATVVAIAVVMSVTAAAVVLKAPNNSRLSLNPRTIPAVPQPRTGPILSFSFPN